MGTFIKFILFGIIGVIALFVIGFFPPLAVAVTALGIVFMFLVFGKE